MSDSQCPVCDKSLDDGTDHSLCILSVFAAIFVSRGSADIGQYRGASCFEQCAEPPGNFFGNTHDEQVARCRERCEPGRIYGEFQGTITQLDGKWVALARISFAENPDNVELRAYVCHHLFDTNQEAVSAVDDFHEEYVAFCKTQGEVTMQEDPLSGRKMN